MIESLLITNYKNESLLLVLENPWASGIAVISTKGIGPEKAIINTTELANSDSTLFNSAKMSERNIVLTLKPLSKTEVTKSMEEGRMKIYNFFPLKSQIKFQVNTDIKKLYIYGYIESCEPDIFSNDEKVNISIICPDPYWRVSEQGNYILGGNKKFEFPFSNEITSYSFYSKWKDARKFTWDQVNFYGWTWDNVGKTIGKVSSLVDRYYRLLEQQPINKDKVNTVVEEIYKIDTQNFMQVYPIN